MDPVIVAGMHRSGTSAVARLLQRLGLGLGEHLVGPSSGNVHGHFEELAFIDFHNQLIRKYCSRQAPFCDWLPLEFPEALPYDEADRREAALLWQAHRASGGGAWKDPRSTLFLDLWLEVLPQARVVACARHPYDVHLSLLRRGEAFLLGDYAAGLRGWMLYNERLLRAVAPLGPDRLMWIDMEADFANGTALATRAARFLGLGDPPSDAAGAIDLEQVHLRALRPEIHQGFAVWFPEIENLHRGLRGSDPLPATDETRQILSFPLEVRLDEFEKQCGVQETTRRQRARLAEEIRKYQAEGKSLMQPLN